VFTARYALSPYIKQIRFVFKGLNKTRAYTERWQKCIVTGSLAHCRKNVLEHVVIHIHTHRHTHRYSRIIFTKSPSFYIKTVSESLTNLTAILPQSHDCSCYVSRRILAPPSFWLQKHTDVRAHDFEHYAKSDISLGLLSLPAPEAGDLVELILLYENGLHFRYPPKN
jgi:hypothetical protein